MELPQTLLDRYHVSKPKPKKVERQPMFRTFPAMLTFSDGRTESVEITAPNKPYWAGQLERDIMAGYNRSAPPNGSKVVRAKVFRNTREGGIQIVNNRVINVY